MERTHKVHVVHVKYTVHKVQTIGKMFPETLQPDPNYSMNIEYGH